jgi:hypothetical protein
VNPWDVATWLSAVALAASAVVIFGFFLRDAKSILNREMHPDSDEGDGGNPATSNATPEPTRPDPAEKLPE